MFCLAPHCCFCNIRIVAKQPVPSGDNAVTSFDSAWQDVRADGDIQFVGKAPKPPEEPPQWWTDFLDWLREFMGPVSEALVAAWPVLRIILLVLLAAGVLTLLWVILSPYIDDWRRRRSQIEGETWQPDHSVARRLLDEADALAAKGKFDEAAHLLLFRSIEEIEKRRPDLLRPSNTSREIEQIDSLPEAARNMFAVIAEHVERGVFAAVPIGEQGWNASRNAYGEFALAENWRPRK
ncbi:hypothetical protein MNBD_ALPHA04-232 [hydrothermal vent metagenome]|uniref:DUF4129 domain-containing protein n=1 Tax=hydrothermal vent metagenome TaxID=652676 RepID=A0A3B0R4V8_9ZZZZ